MKIEQSDISLLASHQKHHEIKESERLEMWDSEEDAPERLQQGDRLELSENFKTLQQRKVDDSIAGDVLDPKLMSIVRALETLMGKKIDISFFHRAKAPETQPEKISGERNEPKRLGWGIDYHYERSEITEEALSFSAQGSVKTEGGAKIDFSLALNMKNHSEVHESLSFKAGDALIDPLVLNFGSDTVSISDIKHTFDLDLDGKSDTFSFVGSGSGFLALDKNGDGIINDGSELFGPSHGNGFEELRAYDTDQNNWIDENDDLFEKLLIWTKDEEGIEHLYSLKEKDIGALYLQSVITPFELQASDGTSEGEMRESSIYLNEKGGVGTVQEIDLKI